MKIKFGVLRIALFLFTFLWCGNFGAAQTAPLDAASANQYFREAQTACDRDNGKLWGLEICGPMMFVDSQTRQVIANQGDSEGNLTKKDDVFVGRLGDKIPVANYSLNWAGKKWAMIVWSTVSTERFRRVKLMIHESFHRVQNQLKFPIAGGISNNHLDSMEGRIWLQLEWRALRRALISSGKERHKAIEDALTFRQYRRLLFPQTDISERALEMHEGLAEYTGYRISATDDKELIEFLTRQINQVNERPSFVGSFAYLSGPSYGVLLDSANPAWRIGLTPQNDLGTLLQQAYRIKLPNDLKAKAEKQAVKYDGITLKNSEKERETARLKRIAEYRAKLVDGPTLLIELSDKGNVTLNSSSLIPLENIGIIYPTATVTDDWGTLQISNGALMIRSEGGRIKKIYLSRPMDINTHSIKGDGWSLRLDDGWIMTTGQRTGDYVLTKITQRL